MISKKQIKIFFQSTATIFISVLIIISVVKAGTITPPSGGGEPVAKFYTLSEIYDFITINTTATEGGHGFTFLENLGGTGRTLSEIYNALAGLISADKVKTGTTYLGVDGTLVPSGGDAGTNDVCNGNTFFGSSQTDWNLQTGTLNPTASAIISGNTYCGVAGTAVATPTYGDNDASKVLTIAGNAGTYDAANLSVENVRNAITFGVGQSGTFSGNLAYGDDNAANVLTVASTPGTYNVSNLSNSVVKQNTTWGVSLGSTGTLTPDGGTASVADLFNSKTAHLTSDWSLDTGTLDLACNTATFDGTENIVADAYDGAGLGNNRWCMTDSGDAATSDILSGKIAWVDGAEVTGAYNASNLDVGTVKSGTSFGVNLTGGYPSATNSLPGDTVATDATAGEVCNTNEAWTKAGSLLTGTLNPTATTVRVGNTYCGVDGTYSGYPGTNWVANGSGDGSTALNQANCGTALGWEWFEDGNGDGDTTDPEDGICVKSSTVDSLSWNGYGFTTNYDNTYIAAYTCLGNFPYGSVANYSGLDSAGNADNTWNDGDCALCQADCYDGKKDLPDQGGYTSNTGGASGYQGPITPEVLKEWKGTRLPTSNDFFGFCGATNGDSDSTPGDSFYHSSGASSNVNIGNYGKNVGRGTGSEYMDLSNSLWEWLSEQRSGDNARVAGLYACSHFYHFVVSFGYRFRAVFRP